jgi:hypothetical protein
MVWLLLLFCSLVTGSFVNKEVKRVLSWKNGLVTIDVSIRCSSLSGEDKYVYLVQPNNTLALLIAVGLRTEPPLPVLPRPEGGFIIDLASFKKTDGSFVFSVTEYLVDGAIRLSPPANFQPTAMDGKVSREEWPVAEQAVVLVQNSLAYSQYQTLSDTLEVVLNGALLEVAFRQPQHMRNKTVVFGPTTSVRARSIEMVKISSLNPTPLLTAPRLRRQCRVSLWSGAMFCIDSWELANESVKPEPFPLQVLQAPLQMWLPIDASQVTFRDRLGVLQSEKAEMGKLSQWNFRPRYSLVGGSRAEFEVSYWSPRPETNLIGAFAPVGQISLIRELSFRLDDEKVLFRHNVVVDGLNDAFELKPFVSIVERIWRMFFP